jgi:RNA polymerase sigma factor (sigma-70 family)
MASIASSARHPALEKTPIDDIAALLRQGYRFALSLTHDASAAEDLLQDGWVAVLRAAGPPTAPYLITAIRSRWVDQHRRALIAPTESLDAKPRLAWEIENKFWHDPCDRVAIKATLERALGLLRPEERAVLVLSAVEGYTGRYFGEVLGSTRGTVLSLMHRTRAKMRRWLKDPSDPEERR